MSEKKDGELAFPAITIKENGRYDRPTSVYHSGMTLRDYFAAHCTEDDVRRHRFSNLDGSERKPALTVEQAKKAFIILLRAFAWAML